MAAMINTNVSSLNARRNLNASQNTLNTSLQRLSSGMRINSAKDDAAGLAISQRFTAQIRGLDQARRNASDGISLAQTAEGAMQTTSDILQRMRELTIQSANGTNSGSDRQALQAEVSQLTQELDRISRGTQFNGQNILDGSSGSTTFQVGASNGQTIDVAVGDLRTTQYGNYRLGGYVASSLTSLGDVIPGTNISGGQKSSYVLAGNATATAGTVTVASATGSATISYNNLESSAQIAEKINAQSGTTGVRVTGMQGVTFDNLTAGGSFTIELANKGQDTTNTSTISFKVGSSGNLADDYAEAITAFNKASNATGFVAKMNSNNTGILLESNTGETLWFANKSATGASFQMHDWQGSGGSTKVGNAANTLTGANGVRYHGRIVWDSDQSFTVNDTITTLMNNTGPQAAQLQSVNNINITTVDAANRSLAIIDSALINVSSQRGRLGALQSRFEVALSNLQTSSENFSASRSRISDADFANETARLTRSQILQQAGTAMLAQANTLPQSVMALLR